MVFKTLSRQESQRALDEWKNNNKEIKVNLTFNQISQETAKKFVTDVENWYNTTITKSNQKVG